MIGSAQNAPQRSDGMLDDSLYLYKDRFDNLFRVAKKITSCLNIGDILEIIRDEVKIILPHAGDACLILVDPDAPNYTRPLHCTIAKENINCHLCRRGRAAVQHVLQGHPASHCVLDEQTTSNDCISKSGEQCWEVALPIYEGVNPLAVLNVVTVDGKSLDDRDMVLLNDLAELAANTIVNAKNYSKMARDKLSLERILGHIGPFVPETVRKIIEKNPDSPALDKSEVDVSILFLDVADYTRISETLTRDKVNFIIEKYFSNFLDVVCSYQGDVNETAGDGLMAIFQGTAEENARNACTAAMEIRRRTIQINNELKGLFHPIVVNMGINSGKALVGMSRFQGASGTRMTFTASGTTTNIAARLASIAKDGDILVGPETAARIKQNTLLFDRGLIQLKNIQERIHVFSLVPA